MLQSTPTLGRLAVLTVGRGSGGSGAVTMLMKLGLFSRPAISKKLPTHSRLWMRTALVSGARTQDLGSSPQEVRGKVSMEGVLES